MNEEQKKKLMITSTNPRDKEMVEKAQKILDWKAKLMIKANQSGRPNLAALLSDLTEFQLFLEEGE